MKNWIRSQVRAVHACLIWQGAHQMRGQKLPLTDAKTIIFAPHPDDETIGCGGLIALKRQKSVPVSVVFLTDGRHCYGQGGPPETEVAALRHEEALAALRVLNVSPEQVFFLDLEDGSLGALSQNARAEAIARLSAILQDFKPEEIYLPHRHDHHKDHEAAFVLVHDALNHFLLPKTPTWYEYVIWHFWEAPLFRLDNWQQIKGARYLPIKEVLTTKQGAISAYRSQLALLPRLFVWQHCRPVEIFYDGQA